MADLADSLAVIVPAYNAGKYLSDLVASIYGGSSSIGEFKGQKLQPEEIIICDDCSTDNTEEVLLNLNKLDSRVRFCRTPKNSGTSAACNEAIRNTECRVLTRIDADDMRESNSFEHMFPHILNNPRSMIYDDITIVSNGVRRREWVMEDYNLDTLLCYNYIHAGVMFTRKAWEECGGYREQFRNGRDDWSFNVALGSVGYYGIHVRNSGYLYRRDKQNRSLNNGSSEWQQKFCTEMEKEFHEVYIKRNKMGCCGNRQTKTTAQSSGSNPAQMVVGSEGMTILVYRGSNIGTESYFGPVTGSVYRFSSKEGKNRKNVDNRDLHTDKNLGLLDLHSFGKPLFSIDTSDKVQQFVPAQVQQAPVEKVQEPNMFADLPVQEDVKTEQSELHPILVGDVKQITKQRIKTLADLGITTWEEFVSTPSDKLASALSVSIVVVDGIKQDLIS